MGPVVQILSTSLLDKRGAMAAGSTPLRLAGGLLPHRSLVL